MLFTTHPAAIEAGTTSLSAMLKVTELQEKMKIIENEQLLIADGISAVSCLRYIITATKEVNNKSL